MLRKLIIKPHPAAPDATTGEIDIAAVATVLVTSEVPDHPIDRAFDPHRGPGGTRWIAGEPGEQSVILAFDAPQTIRHILLEIEEPEVARTQELHLSLSCDVYLRNGPTKLPVRCASPSFLSIFCISCYDLVGWSADRAEPLGLPDPVDASPLSYLQIGRAHV